MELDNRIFRTLNYLRSGVPAELAEDILRKIAFTYYLYIKKMREYPACPLAEAAHQLVDSITKEDLTSVFDKEEDLKKAILSCVDDIYFFSGDKHNGFDLAEFSFELLGHFNQEEFLTILNYNFPHTFRDESTPESVSELVLALAKLYGVNSGRVTDIACAKGDFLLRASKTFKIVEGVEINQDNVLISRMRMYANEINGEIRNSNCFEDSWHHQCSKKLSNLVFAEFPWKLIVKDPREKELMYNCNANRFLLQDGTTTDFFFLSAMMNYLDKNNSIAIGVVPLSSLSNLSDKIVREQIVSRGFLKAVVTLPANLFSRTAISTALVVLSNKETSNILFFDGSNFCHQENRKWNVINVEELIKAISLEIENCENRITNEMLKEHDYSFSPVHYLSDIKRMIPNATELENVADIFTGWQCPSAKLEQIHKTDGTGTKLLQMSNVENGSIVNKLEKYDIPENTIEKFKVQKGDVVISTKSLRVKSAVVDLDTTEPIIASGSIMVIRPKEGKLDPYFLVSFFESDLGKETLKMYQTGSVIPNLSIGNVKKLPLPCLDYPEQQKIGAEYMDLRDLIVSEKRRLEGLQERANKLLDNLWDKKEGK